MLIAVSLCKILKITRQACIQSVASAVDNLSLWKQLGNHPEIFIVVRHFVGHIVGFRCKFINMVKIFLGHSDRIFFAGRLYCLY